jgi:BirA family transcriptional regulator, biotin operon repressor / biotin---[acetyl-CoA-carboxylase] ligase
MPDSTIDLRRVLAETFVARAEHHPTLGSTNDRARECLGDGGPMPLLVVADQQTRGRGRGANRWWTGPGCLAFSLLLSPETTPSDPRRRPLVALAAGVAIVDAIRPLVDQTPIGLHWPNDVFVGSRKLSGVLVEVPAEGSHVVGIGVNTNNSLADAPADIRDRAVTLYDLTGRRHDQTGILVEILKHFDRALDQARACPEALVRRANELCLQIGRTLAIRAGTESAAGRCAGIAPNGALLLDTPDGRREFHGGTLG